MSRMDVIRAWGSILRGDRPVLSVEITRECPLRCPGCYAYEDLHLGEAGPLRSLADFRGAELVERLFRLVEERRPVYISIVGGEPLVRHRELDVILPRLSAMGIGIQLVTSAVRPIPAAWRRLPRLTICVSVDGLAPDHDARRAPATYDRILESIRGHRVIVHCTVTRQMALRERSFEEFLSFWSGRPEVWRIWFSLFTPQAGDSGAEILPPEVKEAVLGEMSRLRPAFPKLYLPDAVIEGYRSPPSSPADCIFAQTTACVTADLRTPITPCQFGGTPDCTRCGCMASAGIQSLAEHRILGLLPVRTLYTVSRRIGRASRDWREALCVESPRAADLPAPAGDPAV